MIAHLLVLSTASPQTTDAGGTWTQFGNGPWGQSSYSAVLLSTGMLYFGNNLQGSDTLSTLWMSVDNTNWWASNINGPRMDGQRQDTTAVQRSVFERPLTYEYLCLILCRQV